MFFSDTHRNFRRAAGDQGLHRAVGFVDDKKRSAHRHGIQLHIAVFRQLDFRVGHRSERRMGVDEPTTVRLLAAHQCHGKHAQRRVLIALLPRVFSDLIRRQCREGSVRAHFSLRNPSSTRRVGIAGQKKPAVRLQILRFSLLGVFFPLPRTAGRRLKAVGHEFSKAPEIPQHGIGPRTIDHGQRTLPRSVHVGIATRVTPEFEIKFRAHHPEPKLKIPLIAVEVPALARTGILKGLRGGCLPFAARAPDITHPLAIPEDGRPDKGGILVENLRLTDKHTHGVRLQTDRTKVRFGGLPIVVIILRHAAIVWWFQAVVGDETDILAPSGRDTGGPRGIEHRPVTLVVSLDSDFFQELLIMRPRTILRQKTVGFRVNLADLARLIVIQKDHQGRIGIDFLNLEH